MIRGWSINSALGRRLLFWFVTVGLVPLIAMAYQGYHCARQMIEWKVRDHMLSVVEGKRAQIEAWLAERRADLQLLAQAPECRRLLATAAQDSQATSALHELLARTQRRSAAYENIIAYHLDGSLLAQAQPAGLAHEPPQLPIPLEQALRGNRVVTSTIHAHAHGGPGLHLLETVADETGHPIGFVMAAMNLKTSLDALLQQAVGLGETGEAYLVGPDGLMLTQSRLADEPTALYQQIDTDAARRALRGESGYAKYDGYRGYPVVGAFAWMPDMRWAMIAEQSTDEALHHLDILQIRAVLMGVVVLVVVYLGAGWLARRISRPAHDLAQATEQVAAGNLDLSVPADSADELGTLARSFNAMVASLKSSRQQLEQRNVELQQAYSELVATQDQLVRSERLAAIGQITSSIVHEIRNPLSSVKINLQILERQVSDQRLQKHTGLAFGEVQRLERMLTDILEFGRQPEMRFQWTDPRIPLQDAVCQVAEQTQERQIEIECDYRDPPDAVWVDSDRLTQALTNLLLNAVQASPDGDQVDVIVDRCAVNYSAMVTYEVCDHGSGIPPERLEKVFEPFFSTKENGAGLGLANVKKIVDLLRGCIDLNSQPGQGTCFRISIPEQPPRGSVARS